MSSDRGPKIQCPKQQVNNQDCKVFFAWVAPKLTGSKATCVNPKRPYNPCLRTRPGSRNQTWYESFTQSLQAACTHGLLEQACASLVWNATQKHPRSIPSREAIETSIKDAPCRTMYLQGTENRIPATIMKPNTPPPRK